MNLRECPVCRRMWNDVDNSGVCPAGHEPAPVDDDDDWPIAKVTI